ncbi:NAD(P)H-binding protein [Kitasatospora sp. NPDC056327]|uniref:NAD(P)H-binding protein n=1 Tax=Kitasatospora sp. NPDC056327 TaxID=3345785 RepID=UPI0035DCF90A
MRSTVFGASGNTGGRIMAEAAARAHRVTAALRTPSRPHRLPAAVGIATGDARDPAGVRSHAAGQDVPITATRPAPVARRRPGKRTREARPGTAGIRNRSPLFPIPRTAAPHPC